MKKSISIVLMMILLSGCNSDPNTINTISTLANAALSAQPQPNNGIYNAPANNQNPNQQIMNLVNALSGTAQTVPIQTQPPNSVAPNIVPPNATYIPANSTFLPAVNGGYYVIPK